MGSKNMFKTNSFAIPFANSSQRHFFNTHTPLFSAYSSKPISKIRSLPLQTNGFSSISHANVPGPGISPLKTLYVYVIIDYICVGGLVDTIILCKDCWRIHKTMFVRAYICVVFVFEGLKMMFLLTKFSRESILICVLVRGNVEVHEGL